MVQKAVEMGASTLQPVLTRHTQVSRVNSERMRANVIEAAEQCGILSLADGRRAGAARPLSRPARDAARLLVFCDEAAEVADPVQALQQGAAAGRDRRPDRPRRRICRGGTRAAAAAAENPAAVAGARGSCGPIPPASRRWRWCRRRWATGPIGSAADGISHCRTGQTLGARAAASSVKAARSTIKATCRNPCRNPRPGHAKGCANEPLPSWIEP